MAIGIDLDDVLADFFPAFLGFYNQKHNTHYTVDDLHSYDIWKVFGGTKEEAIKDVYEFCETKEFQTLAPVEGAIEAINSLNGNHKRYIITARPIEIKDKTLSWLDLHFQGCFEDIFFTNRFSYIGTKQKKSDFCNKINAEIMIEDALHHAHDCSSENRQVLLLDKPWNRNGITPENLEKLGITRVHSWDDIMKKIENYNINPTYAELS